MPQRLELLGHSKAKAMTSVDRLLQHLELLGHFQGGSRDLRAPLALGHAEERRDLRRQKERTHFR